MRPWYWGWNVLLISVLVQGFTFGLLFSSFALWVAPWMDTFNGTRAEIMVAIMAAQIGGAVLAPFIGHALDKQSIRLVMSGGVLAFACALVALTFVTAVWQISAIYLVLMAPGLTMAGPMASQALATRWFQANRGLAIGIGTTGTAVGGATMPLIAAWLLHSYGWQTTNLILAGVAIAVVIPLTLFLIRNTPDEVGVEIEPAGAMSTHGLDQAGTEAWTLGRIFRERNFWITIIAFVGPMIVVSGFMVNIASYAADVGISAQKSATLISALSVAMICSKLVFGSLADRVDHRILYCVGMTMIVVSLGLMTGAPIYIVLLGISILMGMGVGCMLPLVGAIISTSFGVGAFGRVLGLVYMSFSSAAIGAPLAGAIRDQTGSYNPFFYFGMAIIVLGAICIFWLREPRKQQPANSARKSSDDPAPALR